MVAVLLADGFEEVEAITPVDFLRRAGVDVRLVGLEGTRVTGGHGIVVQADSTLAQLSPDPDALVLPGGGKGAENIAASGRALELIRRLCGSGRIVAAICAAPAVVLHKAGVLAGKRVTCYPGFENRLEGCTFVEDRVVVDGNIITSRAPGTAAEFSMALIEILAGKEKAASVHDATLQK